ncbi:hypothetical protein ABT381_04820 [Streptomyces sp. NPDC000151]|uniref:hypothetical protein n=1 Tax=Streptomyces sp. NPDC000151 TaxID=3154244 RepID=UPI00332E3503
METLRRLPWTEEGRAAYVPLGDGIVNHLADVMEAEILGTAKADVSRARALVGDSAASRTELCRAVQYLACAVEDAALVADLRAERLASVRAPGRPV